MKTGGYVKTYYSVLDDEKLLSLEPAYRWAWLLATLYSGRKQLDGFFSNDAARRMVGFHDLPDDCWEGLIGAGLMDPAEGGYVVHDYLEHQTSAAEIVERRARLSATRAVAGRKGGVASGKSRSKPEANEANAQANEANSYSNEANVEANGEANPKQTRSRSKKKEEDPSLRSGSLDVATNNTARERARADEDGDDDFATDMAELRIRLVKERAVDVARHWATLSGQNVSLHKAEPVAKFEIPLPMLLDCLDRCYEAGIKSLQGCRMRLQRLEAEARRVEGERKGQVSVAERLSVISGRGAVGATA